MYIGLIWDGKNNIFGKPQIHLSFEKLQIFATFYKWIFFYMVFCPFFSP